MKRYFMYEDNWDLYQGNPTLTETTVGVDPAGRGVKELKQGDYHMGIMYHESRKFGDLILRRSSQTFRPFHVKAK